MKKMLIAAALMAVLAGPVFAQQTAPSGSTSSKAQGFQGAQPSQRMGHYRSGRHHYHGHQRSARHHMRHHRHHAM